MAEKLHCTDCFLVVFSKIIAANSKIKKKGVFALFFLSSKEVYSSNCNDNYYYSYYHVETIVC